MVNGMTRPFKWAGVLILAAFSTATFAAPCDPEEDTWMPSRYYPPGQTVFHQGDWYQSRELHEGKTPGADFEWERLASVPDCGTSGDDSNVAERKSEGGVNGQPQAASDAGQSPVKASNVHRQTCKEPKRWSFGGSYTVSQIAVHEGQTYRAIRPSNGQMPGMSQPPHWQPVDDPCNKDAKDAN